MTLEKKIEIYKRILRVDDLIARVLELPNGHLIVDKEIKLLNEMVKEIKERLEKEILENA
jgi:hypothetical protein